MALLYVPGTCGPNMQKSWRHLTRQEVSKDPHWASSQLTKLFMPADFSDLGKRNSLRTEPTSDEVEAFRKDISHPPRHTYLGILLSLFGLDSNLAFTQMILARWSTALPICSRVPAGEKTLRITDNTTAKLLP